MYKELKEFVSSVAVQRSFWKDGELWTALVIGIAAGIWIWCDQNVAQAIRRNFGELLTVASIISGFVMATLVFYLQAVNEWADDEPVQKVADKLIDWHVWTVLCLMALIAYTVILWACGRFLDFGRGAIAVEYGLLVFLSAYSGLQIVNHVLTVRWAFKRRKRLKDGASTKKPEKPQVPSGEELN